MNDIRRCYNGYQYIEDQVVGLLDQSVVEDVSALDGDEQGLRCICCRRRKLLIRNLVQHENEKNALIRQIPYIKKRLFLVKAYG